MKRAIVVVAALLVGACSRGLSHDEALRTISTHKSLRPADNITVDAISSSAPNEAIVRATIAGETTNLKLRRFDSGWVWEFVETKAGGWIAPDVAIAQIREIHRDVAAAEWARQHKEAYASTAVSMNTLMLFAPNPYMGLSMDVWVRHRLELADTLDRDPRRLPSQLARAALLRDLNAKDAWGSEFLFNIDSAKKQVVIVSIGPDKVRDTEDDLICLMKEREEIEAGSVVWAKDNNWKLPEGLGDVVAKFTEKPWGTIEYSRVVKP